MRYPAPQNLTKTALVHAYYVSFLVLITAYDFFFFQEKDGMRCGFPELDLKRFTYDNKLPIKKKKKKKKKKNKNVKLKIIAKLKKQN